jgi:ATP-grasp domain, R2K clade family 2
MILYQELDNNARWAREARPDLEWVSYWLDRPLPSGPIQGAIGTIQWTKEVIRKCGLEQPKTIGYETYPELQPFWGRNVEVCTLGDFRFRCNRPGGASLKQWFVKPAEDLKLWTGQGFGSDDHPYLTPHHSDTRIEIHEVVNFVDEYRIFHDGKSAPTYAGYPVSDSGVVVGLIPSSSGFNGLRKFWYTIEDHIPKAPIVVDIGLCDDGHWRIVEIGEPWAMGAYGAESHYMGCHMQWWKELQK